MGYSMALRSAMKYGEGIGKKIGKHPDFKLAVGVGKTLLKGGSPLIPPKKKGR